jgi:glucosamine--fructose-6-phosphate aminotransferase (isomerizing)
MGTRHSAICNVVGSTIARETCGGVYLHAGAEIGVASTKAFTSQVCVLAMLALYFGRTRHLSPSQARADHQDLQGAAGSGPGGACRCHDRVKAIANKYADARNCLYLGRQYCTRGAGRGVEALRRSATSTPRATGRRDEARADRPGGRGHPSVFLVPRGAVFDKVMSNMQEIKARGGPVIAVAGAGDRDVAAVADDVIPVPDVPEYLQPVVTAIPLQLLAYEVALLRGCDVDSPRNLAKSVTVE